MVFIFITLLIDILGIGIVIPVLPKLIEQMAGGDVSLAGWYGGMIGASYAVAQFFCAPIVGALSDRFGRRPILLMAMFGAVILARRQIEIGEDEKRASVGLRPLGEYDEGDDGTDDAAVAAGGSA